MKTKFPRKEFLNNLCFIVSYYVKDRIKIRMEHYKDGDAIYTCSIGHVEVHYISPETDYDEPCTTPDDFEYELGFILSM